MLCVDTVDKIVVMGMIRRYSELSKLDTFEERFEYLKLSGVVGAETFGYDRYLNQMLYTSQRWRRLRSDIIIRDNACDLGIEDREIYDRILIHHLNPITIEDILRESEFVFSPEFLICTTLATHNAIHYGDANQLPKPIIERSMNDTIPWR